MIIGNIKNIMHVLVSFYDTQCAHNAAGHLDKLNWTHKGTTLSARKISRTISSTILCSKSLIIKRIVKQVLRCGSRQNQTCLPSLMDSISISHAATLALFQLTKHFSIEAMNWVASSLTVQVFFGATRFYKCAQQQRWCLSSSHSTSQRSLLQAAVVIQSLQLHCLQICEQIAWMPSLTSHHCVWQ